MQDANTAPDLVELLQRRSRILRYIRDRPREKRAFVDDLGVPRSTLDRAIRELEAADIVAYTDGKYGLTPLGERLAQEFFAFSERAEIAVRLEPFLRWTTPEDFDLDLRLLADADLWTPEPNDPYAMVNRHVAAIKEADRVEVVTPIIGLHAMEMSREQVVENGARHEFVVEAGVLETLRTDENYAPVFRELEAHERNTVSVYDGPIPFFVGVFDDELVQIGVDEDGEPRALVETDREEVRDWAYETIDQYEQQAVPTTELAQNLGDD